MTSPYYVESNIIPLRIRKDANDLDSLEVDSPIIVQGVEIGVGNIVDFCDIKKLGRKIRLPRYVTEGEHKGYWYVTKTAATNDPRFRREMPEGANAIIIGKHYPNKDEYEIQPCRLERINVSNIRRF